jgi:chromosome segregation ATPase
MAREAAKKVEQDFQTKNTTKLLPDNPSSSSSSSSSPNRKVVGWQETEKNEERQVVKDHDQEDNDQSSSNAGGQATSVATVIAGDEDQSKNPSLASRDPNSVSKEELIEILQKMNKRVKALAAVKIQLIDRVKVVENEKSRLVDLVKNEILSNVDLEAELSKKKKSLQQSDKSEDMDEIKMFQLAWRAADERNQLALQQLQNEYKAVSIQFQEQVEKVKKEAQDEIHLQVEKKMAEWIESTTGSASGVVKGDGGSIVQSDDEYYTCKQELEKARNDLLRFETKMEQMELNHSKQLETMEKKHEEHVNQVKQEAAEDKAKSIAKLKEMVKEKLIAMKSGYEDKIRSLSEQSGVGGNGADQAALDTMKNEHEKEMNKLKAQLDEASTQIKLYEKQLVSVRDELQVSHQAELNNIKENFMLKESEWKVAMEEAAANLEKERSTINDRIQEALENSSKSIQTLESEKLELAQKEFERKVDEMQALHEQELLREQKEVAALLQKLDEMGTSHANNIQSLKECHEQDLTRVVNELQTQAKRDLMEMESSYESKIASLNEEYASKQDLMVAQLKDEFESEISRLKVEHETALDQIAADTEKEVADKYAVDLACVREQSEKSYRDSLQTMKDELTKQKNEEIQSVKEEAAENLKMAVCGESDRLSMITQEYEVKIHEIQSAHDNEVAMLQSEATSLAARIQELEATHTKELEKIRNEAKSETESAILRQNKEFKTEIDSMTSDLKLKYENEIQEIHKRHEEEIVRIREEHSASLDALAQVAGEETNQQHTDEVNKIKEEIQQSHFVEIEKLRNDIDHLKAELKERVAEAYKEGEKKATESENETITNIKRCCDEKIMKLQSIHEKEIVKVTDEANSLACRLQDLESAHSKEIRLLNEEHGKQVDAIRSDIENEKVNSLAEMKHEMERKIAMLESSYEEKLANAFESKEMQRNLETELTKNDELSKQYSALLASFNETEETNKSLERRLSQIELDHYQSIDSLKSKCESLENEKMTILSQMEEGVVNEKLHLDKIQHLEKELMTSKANVDQLSIELKDQTEFLLSANQNIDKLEETNQSMKVENMSLSEVNMSLEHEVKSMRNTLENVKETAETQVKQLLQETDELRDIIDKRNNETTLLMESHQNDITLLQEELTGARESLKRIKEEHALELARIEEENTKSVAMASEDIVKIREESNRQISEEQQKYHEMVSVYELRLKNLQSEIDNALKTVEEVKEEAESTLSNANEERKKLISEHSKALAVLKGEIDAMSAQRNEVETIEEAHRTDIKELKNQYEAKLSELERAIKSEKDVAEMERKRFLDKIASLEKLVSDSSSSIDNERDRIKNEVSIYYDEKLKEIMDENEVKKKEIVDKLTVKFNEKLQAAIDEHEHAKSELKDKMAQHTDELKFHFEEKMNKAKAEFDAVKSQVEAEKVDIRQELSICEEKLLSVQEDRDTLKHQLQVEISTVAKLQNLLDASKKELLDSQLNSAAATDSLLAQQEKMRSDIKQLEEEIRNLQKDLSAKSRQNEELSAKLISLQHNLDELCNEKKQMEEMLEASSKQVAKLNAIEKELEKSREELNSFRLELSQKSSLLLRLQAEQEASEKTHGQRTAIVGMLETQISELNEANIELQAKLEAATYDLRQKDDDLHNASADIEQLRRDLDEVTGKLEVATENSSERNSKLIFELEIQEKATLISSLQKEIVSLQQQMAKKSSTAQRLLQQCEAECQELRNRNKKLQHELDKGSFSERRIFELAAQQSNQESLVTSEINIRNQMVERLAEKLQRHDDELASTEYANKQIEREVEELSRIHRREDVNLDYLKSTIVQFLSKPPGSSERVALLPVIATLLQFDSDDYKLIEQGKAKVSWFGSVLPTVITSPGTQGSEIARSTFGVQSSPLLPQSVSSAEVTIAEHPKKRVSRTSGTSLQF